jgi:hypothetical protein
MQIPVEDGVLLLPQVMIAEILPFVVYETVQEDAPKWFVGMFKWQRMNIPLISLDILHGAEIDYGKKLRAVILNTLTSDTGYDYIGVVMKGIPKLVEVSRENLQAEMEGVKKGILMNANLAGIHYMIPDIDALEYLTRKAVQLSQD